MSKYLTTLSIEIRVQPKPRDLIGIYGVNPSTGKPHGIAPDHGIYGPDGRSIFVEIKRQRAAGNAHERACKYFAPGIIKSGREIAKQPDGVIPFWWIFAEGIAEDPRYVREITHWFQGVERHVLLLPRPDEQALTDHFEKHILPLLT